VKARARAAHRDEKANIGDAMIENEHVQTNGREATRVDSKYRSDWFRIGGHWPRVTQSRTEYPIMSSFPLLVPERIKS